MAFEFKRLEIKDVILITPQVRGDHRGFFVEAYKYSEFSGFGIKDKFLQDNHSKSSNGVLRGLHYQKEPKAQSKLVRCIKGEILDVAVDVRKNSPDFGKWVSAVLSEENKKMLYIPRGFAHGFLTLSDEAEITYKIDNEYSPECDCGIKWDDGDIDIKWDIESPNISERDGNWPAFADAEVF